MGGHRVRNDLIAALDVGTSKVCCLIAATDGDGDVRVVGIGHQLARGLRSGAIVDMEAAEESVRAAVHAAEEMAGDTINGVALNVGGGQLTSHAVNVEMAIGGHEVSDGDVQRVLDEGRGANDRRDQAVIHTLPVGYAIDGVNGIRDPRGMSGEKLGVRLNVVTTARGPARNLVACVGHCHLDVDMLVAAPYASSLACLVEDEMRLGVTCIDLGAGTTTFAVFVDGEMVHLDALPIGGQHITNDIARGLSTPVVAAERLKTLFGSPIAASADFRELIEIPQVGESDNGTGNHLPRSSLVRIVRARIEETFELVRSRLDGAGVARAAGRRVVLTGGGSQLSGIREAAAQILNKQVRLARPTVLPGLTEAARGPAFAACAGLLVYAAKQDMPKPDRAHRVARSASGRFSRFGQWLRENF